MKNNYLDQVYDTLLRIKTTGTDDSKSNLEYFPYEATPYEVLEQILKLNLITKNNYLLDYGSGKGRVDFYLTKYTKCHSLGIEYDERLYKIALRNKETFNNPKVNFKNINAEEYYLDKSIDRIYFFNPFNINTFKKVFEKILYSFFEAKREILIFFYYISAEYEEYLKTIFLVKHYDTIEIKTDDDRENIKVYSIN